MHGVVIHELKEYVQSTTPVAWGAILAHAGLEGRMFVLSESYPDTEVVALITAASALTGKPESAILEGLGAFMVRDLMTTYGPMIKREWGTADVLAETERTIHRVVRIRDKFATPPELTCVRISETRVNITYSSSRRLCHLARGLIRGIGAHYRDEVTIDEPTCMLLGAAQCLFKVEVHPRKRAGALATIAIFAALFLAAVPAQAATYYVAPNGSDGAAGTETAPFATMARGQTAAAAGDTVYFRGGTYTFVSSTAANGVALSKSGTSGKRIQYWAYQNEVPIFDFSGMTAAARITGLRVTASYIHVKGLEIKLVPQNITTQNESWGIYNEAGANNNIYEMLNLHHNMGPGFFLGGGGNNPGCVAAGGASVLSPQALPGERKDRYW